MKPKFDLLVCATVVATLWGGTANAQVSSQGLGVSDAVYTMTNQLKEFIESSVIQVLNVAGPRESSESGVYRFALEILRTYWQDR
jgi:Circularly permutated YpsA SLOG family